MKIRCKNCYRVLEPQEEYCKNCGTHSIEIQKAMQTGDYGGGPVYRLKMGLILFLIIAFIGSGIFTIIFGTFTSDATESVFNKSNSLLVTSIICTAVLYIVNYKSLKDFFWNGNWKQLFGLISISVIFLVMTFFLPKISSITKVLPNFITSYLHSGTARWFSGKNTNVSFVLLSLILVIIVEEFLFRRLLIDVLDEHTMLGDLMIVLITTLISTVLDFAWMMAPETIIVSLVLNMVCSGFYMYSNRSLIISIIFRILVVVIQFIIYLV